MTIENLIFNLITAVLLVLNLMGLITISWFLVFLPTITVLLGYVLKFVVVGLCTCYEKKGKINDN